MIMMKKLKKGRLINERTIPNHSNYSINYLFLCRAIQRGGTIMCSLVTIAIMLILMSIVAKEISRRMK